MFSLYYIRYLLIFFCCNLPDIFFTFFKLSGRFYLIIFGWLLYVVATGYLNKYTSSSKCLDIQKLAGVLNNTTILFVAYQVLALCSVNLGSWPLSVNVNGQLFFGLKLSYLGHTIKQSSCILTRLLIDCIRFVNHVISQ